MKKTTKAIALILSLLLLLGLAACAAKGGKETPAPPAAATADSGDKASEEPAASVRDSEAPETSEPEPTESVGRTDPEPPATDPVEVDLSGFYNDDDSIVGEWHFEMDVETLLNAAVEAEEPDEEEMQVLELYKAIFSGLQMKIVLNLKADNTYNAYMQEEDARELMEGVKENLLGVIPQLLTVMMGMTEEELQQMLDSQGMTMDEFKAYVAEEFTAEMEDGISGLVDETLEGGCYAYIGGRLYFGEEGEDLNPESYAVIELNGDEMRMVSIVNPEDNESAEIMSQAVLPLIFTR